ncbi:MAG: LysR family transcriptional regulator [Polyangiaceae bacterium]|nr:LysR family transcriptional regulator [Polyangiaceae bacterium]
MDLNRIAVFVRVVEEHGFTAAARTLGLPKSSVSRSVALLEQELGASLLRRSTRKVTLTEAGRAFYDRAARALEAVEEAREAVVELESEVRGPIRITAPPDAGVFLLAPIVTSFAAAHPDVSIDVVLASRVIDLVEERIDLALRAGPLRDPTLVARKLDRFDLALYASPAYLESHRAPRRVTDLADHRCVLFRAGPSGATWKLVGPKGEESIDIRGALNADDYFFVRAAVLSGAGIGLLPTFVASPDDASLVRVLPAHSAPVGPLHLVYPSSSYLPRRVAVFRDYVADALGGRAVAPRSKA